MMRVSVWFNAVTFLPSESLTEREQGKSTVMAAGGKLMAVKEEQALVLRERDIYKVAAEDWMVEERVEVETLGDSEGKMIRWICH